jgi:hypothetical protein
VAATLSTHQHVIELRRVDVGVGLDLANDDRVEQLRRRLRRRARLAADDHNRHGAGPVLRVALTETEMVAFYIALNISLR